MNRERSAPNSICVMLTIAFWTTIFVVVAGSIVRTTGSGLGCPDWPHCFGTWLPPSSVTELPLDYKTRFAVAGREIADFNVFKTWIEYVNRLAGVLLGIVLVALSGLAVCKRRTIPRKMFWGVQAALLIVLVQGGLGAIVVATHLHGQTITLHLALAVALALLLKRLEVTANGADPVSVERPSKIWYRWGRAVYVLAIVQLVLGTEVRKSIDHLVHEFVALPRAEWALHLEATFLVHRSLSLLFVASAAGWFWRSRRERLRTQRHFLGLAACAGIAIFSGVVMRELGFPAWAQPVHLTIGVLLLVQVDRIYRAL